VNSVNKKPEGKKSSAPPRQSTKRQLREAMGSAGDALTEMIGRVDRNSDAIDSLRQGNQGMASRVENAENALSNNSRQCKTLSAKLDDAIAANGDTLEVLDAVADSLEGTQDEINGIRADLNPLTSAFDSAASLARDEGILGNGTLDVESQRPTGLLRALVKRAGKVPNNLDGAIKKATREGIRGLRMEIALSGVPDLADPWQSVNKTGPKDVMGYLGSAIRTTFAMIDSLRRELGMDSDDGTKRVSQRLSRVEENAQRNDDTLKELKEKVGNLEEDLEGLRKDLTKQMSTVLETLDGVVEYLEQDDSQDRDA
jgi:chromosome segregation ATPase